MMSINDSGNSDDDQCFLDQVLNNLYDFGDEQASITKKNKKKRKRRQEASEIVPSEDVCSDTECSTLERHLAVSPLQDTSETVYPDATSIQTTQVEVVTFKDPTIKTRVKPTPTSDLKNVPKQKEVDKSNRDDPGELTFEKARLEVHRFGISGYKKEQQRSFEQERAIMLGAKPPRKQYVNYKMLQQELHEKKKKAKEEIQPDQKKKKHNKPGDRKRKTPSVFGSSSGSDTMGRFKDGMLLLSSKEIETIKGSK